MTIKITTAWGTYISPGKRKDAEIAAEIATAHFTPIIAADKKRIEELEAELERVKGLLMDKVKEISKRNFTPFLNKSIDDYVNEDLEIFKTKHNLTP